MYHSITFGDKNTWDDWKLIPTSRPSFSPPPTKAVVVDLPGSDGIINISSMLVSTPLYNNRSGSFEFAVSDGSLHWEEHLSRIATHIHGMQMRAVLEDDPTYFYEGTFTLNTYKSNKSFASVVIDYTVGPYKKRIADVSHASL